jgi:hypothetical protein
MQVLDLVVQLMSYESIRQGWPASKSIIAVRVAIVSIRSPQLPSKGVKRAHNQHHCDNHNYKQS